MSEGAAIKAYFLLQYRMTNRKIRALGIYPALGWVIGLVCFIGLTEALFLKTELAKYLMVFAAWSLLTQTSERNRTEFLVLVFGTDKARSIRLLENALLSLPSALVLLRHHAFLEALLVVAGSLFLAHFSLHRSVTYVVPTPFSRGPFEVIVGFRTTFYLLFAAYGLTGMAIYSANFNLGVVAMLLVFLVSLTFYSKPEQEYYVWNYSTTPSKFIFGKLWRAILWVGFMVAPILVALAVYSPESSGTLLALALVGFAFLCTIILAKYAAYPHEINLPEGTLVAISISFPPVLLALIPYLYFKAIRKLNVLLA